MTKKVQKPVSMLAGKTSAERSALVAALSLLSASMAVLCTAPALAGSKAVNNASPSPNKGATVTAPTTSKSTAPTTSKNKSRIEAITVKQK